MMNKSLKQRLLDRTITRATGCWEWTGPTCAGYGRLQYDKVAYTAHRAAYLVYHGALPDDLMVLHSCNNRICVNPAHLRLGKHIDNMQDRRAAGRYAREFNGRTKISTQQAEVLCSVYREFEVSYSQLAKLVGVDKTTIGRIITKGLKGDD